MSRIAIIGAGLAGLVLARTLKDTLDISVFEKSRGPGGRMATREAGEFMFDHGAQYFTARSRAFRSFIKPFIKTGLIKEWTPKIISLEKNRKPYKRQWFEPHYVASPGMNRLCKMLADNSGLVVDTEVLGFSGAVGNWYLNGKQGVIDGPFDWVISTAPAPQSLLLMPSCFAHRTVLERTTMSSCYSLMLGFTEPVPLNFDAAVLKNPALNWMAVNSSKPGRESKLSLLINSTNEWANSRLEADKAAIEDEMLYQLEQLPGVILPTPQHSVLHRWRYAATEVAAGVDFLLDPSSQLASCGDWCIEGRVEAAYLSGHKLGRALNRILE